MTIPTNRGSPLSPVMQKRNGRSGTKSASSSGGAAAPEPAMTVKAAAGERGSCHGIIAFGKKLTFFAERVKNR